MFIVADTAQWLSQLVANCSPTTEFSILWLDQQKYMLHMILSPHDMIPRQKTPHIWMAVCVHHSKLIEESYLIHHIYKFARPDTLYTPWVSIIIS